MIWLCLLLSVCPSVTTGGDDSLARTSRVVRPEVRRAFYRSGGRHLIGRKIHLHVEARVLRRKPELRPAPRNGGDYLVFRNRTVPVVIHSKNPFWRQVRRHLNDADEFCLRGTLRIPEEDLRRRAHLFVTRVKRAPGTWRYRSDG